jgi:DNA-binding response OmpR family regulator
MEKKILIVDDEWDWVQMLVMRLRHDGYQLDAAFDAIQAMGQAVQLRPNLVLLDIMMPGGGGLQVLKNMRTSLKLFSTPVIVVTARGDRDTKEAAMSYGISGYFTKPVDNASLLGRIKQVLRETPAEVFLPKPNVSLGAVPV